MKGIGECTNLLTGVGCNLHPSSALYGLGAFSFSSPIAVCSCKLFVPATGSHTLSPRPRAKRKKKEQFAEDEAALKKKADTEAERKAEAIALASAQATPRNRIAYAATPLRGAQRRSSRYGM